MKKTIYMIIVAGAMIGMASCEKENTFALHEEEGMFDTETLDVDYINSDLATRAGNVNTDNFIVRFINSNNETQKSYYYKDMPEVVSLPKGKYKVVADFGANPVAEFESVYYRGEIQEIDIVPNEITQSPGTITCKLSNIKIVVNIAEMAAGITGGDADTSLLGNDVKVVVKVGENGTLTYAKGETRAGYFRYVEGSTTITATFSGTVDGQTIEGISKTYTDANAGNFYTINFNVSKPMSDDPGNGQIGGGTGLGINIDSTITSVDVTTPAVNVDDPYEDIIEESEQNQMENN